MSTAPPPCLWSPTRRREGLARRSNGDRPVEESTGQQGRKHQLHPFGASSWPIRCPEEPWRDAVKNRRWSPKGAVAGAARTGRTAIKRSRSLQMQESGRKVQVCPSNRRLTFCCSEGLQCPRCSRFWKPHGQSSLFRNDGNVPDVEILETSSMILHSNSPRGRAGSRRAVSSEIGARSRARRQSKSGSNADHRSRPEETPG